jgi:hypothetical protein
MGPFPGGPQGWQQFTYNARLGQGVEFPSKQAKFHLFKSRYPIPWRNGREENPGTPRNLVWRILHPVFGDARGQRAHPTSPGHTAPALWHAPGARRPVETRPDCLWPYWAERENRNEDLIPDFLYVTASDSCLPAQPATPPSLRIPHDGIERRMDPSDGKDYTLAEFVQAYGDGFSEPWQWRASRWHVLSRLRTIIEGIRDGSSRTVQQIQHRYEQYYDPLHVAVSQDDSLACFIQQDGDSRTVDLLGLLGVTIGRPDFEAFCEVAAVSQAVRPLNAAVQGDGSAQPPPAQPPAPAQPQPLAPAPAQPPAQNKQKRRRQLVDALVEMVQANGGEIKGDRLRPLYARVPGSKELIKTLGKIRKVEQWSDGQLGFRKNPDVPTQPIIFLRQELEE